MRNQNFGELKFDTLSQATDHETWGKCFNHKIESYVDLAKQIILKGFPSTRIPWTKLSSQNKSGERGIMEWTLLWCGNTWKQTCQDANMHLNSTEPELILASTNDTQQSPNPYSQWWELNFKYWTFFHLFWNLFWLGHCFFLPFV